MSIEIRKPNKTEWEDYKNLRLKALKEFPLAYGSSYEESVKKSDESWISRIQESQDEKTAFTLCAYIEGKMVGMVTVYWSLEPKEKHIGHLVGVYVDTQLQGQGIGLQLINQALERAKLNGLKKINLDVTKGNDPANKLYLKVGFKEVGTKHMETFFHGEYYDMVIMELIF